RPVAQARLSPAWRVYSGEKLFSQRKVGKSNLAKPSIKSLCASLNDKCNPHSPSETHGLFMKRPEALTCAGMPCL
ncbi:hypothetical protein CEXT_2451, partial [Caerostris extrusa]